MEPLAELRDPEAERGVGSLYEALGRSGPGYVIRAGARQGVRSAFHLDSDRTKGGRALQQSARANADVVTTILAWLSLRSAVSASFVDVRATASFLVGVGFRALLKIRERGDPRKLIEIIRRSPFSRWFLLERGGAKKTCWDGKRFDCSGPTQY